MLWFYSGILVFLVALAAFAVWRYLKHTAKRLLIQADTLKTSDDEDKYARRMVAQLADKCESVMAKATGAWLLSLVLFGLSILLVLISCLKIVPARNVGIPVTLGKVGEPLDSGLHFTTPWTRIYTFSTRLQEITMRGDPDGDNDAQKDKKRGVDHAVDLRGSDDGVVYADVTIRWELEQAPADETFHRFRSMDDIENKLIKPDARSLMREAAKTFSSTSLVAENRAEVERLTAEALSERLERYNIRVDQVSIRGIRPSDKVARAIDVKLEKEQEAQQAVIDQQTRKTQAETQVIEAKAAADAAREKAQGEADARRIAAEAEAEANAKVAASLTPEVLEAQRIAALREAGAIYVPSDVSLFVPTQ